MKFEVREARRRKGAVRRRYLWEMSCHQSRWPEGRSQRG